MKATSQTETVETKTTTLTVNRNQLAACALAMAKGDVRYYLNGVKFECRDDGKVIVVGTDGYRLHTGIVGAWEGDKQDFILGGEYVGMLTKRYKSLGGKGYELNAEMTAVTTTTTRPNPDYNPDLAESGVIVGNSGIKEFVTGEMKITFPFKEMQVTVKPLEGQYPDWRRVCKKTAWKTADDKDVLQDWTSEDIVNEWVHFNPNYLLDVSKAFSLYQNNPNLKAVQSAEYGDVAPFGSGKQAIFTKRDVDFLAVVMPIRTSGSIHLNPIDWAISETAEPVKKAKCESSELYKGFLRNHHTD